MRVRFDRVAVLAREGLEEGLEDGELGCERRGVGVAEGGAVGGVGCGEGAVFAEGAEADAAPGGHGGFGGVDVDVR